MEDKKCYVMESLEECEFWLKISVPKALDVDEVRDACKGKVVSLLWDNKPRSIVIRRLLRVAFGTELNLVDNNEFGDLIENVQPGDEVLFPGMNEEKQAKFYLSTVERKLTDTEMKTMDQNSNLELMQMLKDDPANFGREFAKLTQQERLAIMSDIVKLGDDASFEAILQIFDRVRSQN